MACNNDAWIGPVVHGCRADFDFTITFELIVLNLIPASLFCIISFVRIWSLFRRPRVVRGFAVWSLKIVLASLYGCLCLAVLLVSSNHLDREDDKSSILAWSLAARSMNVAAAVSIVFLSSLEHVRSPRPSSLIAIYLSITTLFDASQIRTAWLQAQENSRFAYARLLTAVVFSKFMVLLVEARDKSKWLIQDRKSLSPEETSGIYTLGVFLWLGTLFLRGYRGRLRMEDLYPLDSRMLSTSIPSKFTTNVRQETSWRGKRWGLSKAVFSSLAIELTLPVIPRILLLASTLCQSFLIEALLRILEAPKLNRQHEYALIGATALVYTTIAISTALYWYFQERFTTIVRGSLVMAIYEQTTKLKSGSVGVESGVVTLMSTDVERVQLGIRDIHEYWANLAQAVIACYFLHRILGAAFAVPIVVVLLAAIASTLLGRLMGSRQRAWMAAIQHRVSLTADAIAHMKLIKMSGMAAPVEVMIQSLRISELGYGSRWRLLVAAAATISHAQGLLAPVFTFAITSARLNTSSIFVSLSYLTLLTTPLITLFQKLPQLLGAWTSLQRIQCFLEREPRIDYRHSRTRRDASLFDHGMTCLSPGSESPVELEVIAAKDLGVSCRSITVEQGCFGWDNENPILKNVNVTIPGSKLTIISGPIASGKSTFCKGLLGEVPFSSGTVTLRDKNMRIGYCDQQPVLFNTTIRDNIVGHGHFDPDRYKLVLNVTKLDEDTSDLALGDCTVIGEGGIILSGGQRQRLSLARALYAQRTDLLILDDVLSGLDASTEDDVFQNVFGRQGWIRRHGQTAILCLHDPRRFDAADHVLKINNGDVIEEASFFEASNSTAIARGSTLHEKRPSVPLNTTPAVIQESSLIDHNGTARQAGDWSIYKHYLSTAGVLPCLVFLVASASNGFFHNFPRVWLTFWSNDAAHGDLRQHNQAYYIGIYGLLQVACLLSGVLAAITVFYTIIRRSGARLHDRALKVVIQAPLRFLTTTDTGFLINYFSQDIALIDGELPIALINMVVELFGVLGMAAVLASSAPWLVLIYPGIAMVLWLLQRFYLRTSRQLRLLDLEAKSPLYSHFLDTVKGLATIRAFGWTEHDVARNQHLLDESQRPSYLLAMAQRWLYFWLSMIMMVLATGLVALTTQLRASSSLSGASFTTLMSLSESLRDLVRFYAGLETSIGAVARLRSFTADTPTEHRPGHTDTPPKRWPHTGNISIQNVSASYTGKVDDYAVRDLELEIRSGEKIALCGRTGSGKSSCLLLLLGLLDPTQRNSHSYNLSIDGIQLPLIAREELRERLITVSQDPVFLPSGSTVAQNIDPLRAATSEECQVVLQDLELWDLVHGLGGVTQPLHEESLSHGQRQLFCLARAVLKHRVSGGAVLLLDEFTSAVDEETERRMLEVVRREFRGCTVIIVAHRLGMVLEFCDRVVVMDAGRVVETGNPRILCRMDGTWFAEMMESAGLA